jgi:hypothetical protein
MNSDGRAFTGTYIRVILVEAIILVVLWLVGRAFS